MHMRHLRKRVGTNWMLWGVHLSIYLITLGAIISSDNVDRRISVVVLLGWMGLLILHFLYLGINAQSQKPKHDDLEKPKRTDIHFAVGDDGELIPLNAEAEEQHLTQSK